MEEEESPPSSRCCAGTSPAGKGPASLLYAGTSEVSAAEMEVVHGLPMLDEL